MLSCFAKFIYLFHKKILIIWCYLISTIQILILSRFFNSIFLLYNITLNSLILWFLLLNCWFFNMNLFIDNCFWNSRNFTFFKNSLIWSLIIYFNLILFFDRCVLSFFMLILLLFMTFIQLFCFLLFFFIYMMRFFFCFLLLLCRLFIGNLLCMILSYLLRLWRSFWIFFWLFMIMWRSDHIRRILICFDLINCFRLLLWLLNFQIFFLLRLGFLILSLEFLLFYMRLFMLFCL